MPLGKPHQVVGWCLSCCRPGGLRLGWPAGPYAAPAQKEKMCASEHSILHVIYCRYWLQVLIASCTRVSHNGCVWCLLSVLEDACAGLSALSDCMAAMCCCHHTCVPSFTSCSLLRSAAVCMTLKPRFGVCALDEPTRPYRATGQHDSV